jgi:hypothetical protein
MRVRRNVPGGNRLDDQRDSQLPLNAERFSTPKVQAG